MNDTIINQLKGFLNTPPLWKNRDLCDLEQFELPEYNKFSDLDPIVAMPTLLTNFVLGKRVETFFELVIRQSENYKIIAGNLQVHKNKITVGEIDFLVHDLQQKKDLHIEVVYKFYVYDPDLSEEINRWIGPNRKDSLPQKIQKLKKNQLPLLFKPETKKLLSTFNLQPEDMEQRVCYKANLFVPKELLGKKFPYVNNKCITGYWIHYQDFDRETYGQHEFYAPKKPDWPIHPGAQEDWKNFSQIKVEILDLFQKKKSPLIWMKKGEDQYERFFVVWWLEN